MNLGKKVVIVLGDNELFKGMFQNITNLGFTYDD
jgi:hypothetical protein